MEENIKSVVNDYCTTTAVHHFISARDTLELCYVFPHFHANTNMYYL